MSVAGGVKRMVPPLRGPQSPQPPQRGLDMELVIRILIGICVTPPLGLKMLNTTLNRIVKRKAVIHVQNWDDTVPPNLLEKFDILGITSHPMETSLWTHKLLGDIVCIRKPVRIHGLGRLYFSEEELVQISEKMHFLEGSTYLNLYHQINELPLHDFTNVTTLILDIQVLYDEYCVPDALEDPLKCLTCLKILHLWIPRRRSNRYFIYKEPEAWLTPILDSPLEELAIMCEASDLDYWSDIALLGKFQHLKKLLLLGFGSIYVRWDVWMNMSPSLEELHVSRCTRFSLDCRYIRHTVLKKLTVLNITDCHVKAGDRSDWLDHFPSLRQLTLLNVNVCAIDLTVVQRKGELLDFLYSLVQRRIGERLKSLTLEDKHREDLELKHGSSDLPVKFVPCGSLVQRGAVTSTIDIKDIDCSMI